MRHLFILFVWMASLLLTACDQLPLINLFPDTSGQIIGPGTSQSAGNVALKNYSAPISIDTANRMIRSYLTSINYQENPNAIRSWSFSAETLRNYLNSDTGNKITDIRFFLAHTMAYIESGHEGEPLPENSNQLTLIVVGVNSAGEEVYIEDDEVINHSSPCPNDCYDGDFLEK